MITFSRVSIEEKSKGSLYTIALLSVLYPFVLFSPFFMTFIYKSPIVWLLPRTRESYGLVMVNFPIEVHLMSKFIFIISIIITILYAWLLQALYSLSESFYSTGYGLHPVICFCAAVLATGFFVIIQMTIYRTLSERE